jgi:hypothetical protein
LIGDKWLKSDCFQRLPVALRIPADTECAAHPGRNYFANADVAFAIGTVAIN